jgi:hypothetical protein
MVTFGDFTTRSSSSVLRDIHDDYSVTVYSFK